VSTPPPVERSVFRRLAVITTVMAFVILAVFTLFFAVTVQPNFADPALNARLRRAHFTLILPTLGIIVVVVVIAHIRLLRLLMPLRSLADGVSRLTRGDLNVVISGSSRDEFATLTSGFNQMVARVREMIGARDQLLLDVSHELRSPITRMKVALELLPETDIRDRLASDVREMEAMVTELLELERLREGRTIRREQVDVVLLASNVVASFAGREPQVQMAAISVPRALASVDARMLSLVIRNLVDNAVTHSSPDSGPVTVTVVGDDACVELSVSDEGPGIPESDAGQVFEPFYRVDRSRSRLTGGYGLGLSICKRVVEAHGGTIRLEAKQPRGTTFVVRLPIE
jgi:signal transduction histidine kinase